MPVSLHMRLTCTRKAWYLPVSGIPAMTSLAKFTLNDPVKAVNVTATGSTGTFLPGVGVIVAQLYALPCLWVSLRYFLIHRSRHDMKGLV